MPFSKAQGNFALCRATNKIGLLRKGFSKIEVQNVHKALRILIMGLDTTDELLARIRSECAPSENVDYLIHFVKSSKRGIAIARGTARDAADSEA